MVVTTHKLDAVAKPKEPVSLDKTKKMIRAVLMLCKDGVPSRRFESDYKELARKDLPYQEFGFKSLNAFFESIPDVVRIHKNHGETTYHAVVTGETEHLHKMIIKQKTNKKIKVTSYKGFKAVSRHSQFKHHTSSNLNQNHFRQRTHNSNVHRSIRNHLSYTGVQILPQPLMQMKTLPCSKPFLKQFNNPLSEPKKVTEKSTLSTNLNKSAMKNLLQSHNVVKSPLLPTPKRALLPNPPSLLLNPFLWSPKPALLPTPGTNALLPTPVIPPFMMRTPSFVPRPVVGYGVTSAVRTTKAPAFKNPLMGSDTDSESASELPKKNCKPVQKKTVDNNLECNTDSQKLERSTDEQSPKLGLKTKLKDNKASGIFNLDPIKTELQEVYEDDRKDHSEHFISTPAKVEESFDDARTENDFEIATSPLVQNYRNVVPLKTSRLSNDKFLRNNDAGMASVSLTTEVGEGDCSDVISPKNTLVQGKRSPGKKHVRFEMNSVTRKNPIIDADVASVTDKQYSRTVSTPEPYSFGMTGSTPDKSPVYVVSPVKSIFKIAEFGKFVNVIVTAIPSPWKFYVMPLEILPVFEDFNQRLNKHFHTDKNNNPLHTSVLKEGSIYAAFCAVNDINSWERVKVCKIAKNFASVFLIDRAVMDCVSLSKISELPISFKSRAPFVMQAKLAGIKPVGVTKTVAGEDVVVFDNDLLSAKFQERVLNKKFVAHVIKSSIVGGELVYDVCLCDTNDSDYDVWLNDLIVEDWKLAEYIVKM